MSRSRRTARAFALIPLSRRWGAHSLPPPKKTPLLFSHWPRCTRCRTWGIAKIPRCIATSSATVRRGKRWLLLPLGFTSARWNAKKIQRKRHRSRFVLSFQIFAWLRSIIYFQTEIFTIPFKALPDQIKTFSPKRIFFLFLFANFFFFLSFSIRFYFFPPCSKYFCSDM